jgi:hypothetical protein
MQCADCPDIPNGTRKRAICCVREGRAAREADFINSLPPPRALGARAAALAGTQLTSEPGGAFRRFVYNGAPAE